ncbi:MAG: tetratricopeptide repeat protein [Alphaproteobacteria bacterium]
MRKMLSRIGMVAAFLALGFVSPSTRAEGYVELEQLIKQADAQGMPAAGNAHFAFRAGHMMLNDKSVYDPERGAQYLEKAHSFRHVDAGLYLAQVLFEGREGLPPDIEKAKKFLLASARGGNPEAMVFVAKAHLQGYAVGGVTVFEKDEAVAFKKIRLAALYWGCKPEANIVQAKMHLNGVGTKVDKESALLGFENAVANGGSQAIGILLHLYATDPEIKAIVDRQNSDFSSWEKRGLLDGNHYRLGLRALIGLGMPKNTELGIQYLQKGTTARDFSSPAHFLLGSIYLGDSRPEAQQLGRQLLARVEQHFQQEQRRLFGLAYHYGIRQLAQGENTRAK